MISSSSSKKIELDGDLTIAAIGDVYAKFNDAFLDNATIEIAIDDESDVDISFVQLMQSARNTAERNGVTLVLSSPAAGQLLNTLQRGGFLSAEMGNAASFWQAGL